MKIIPFEPGDGTHYTVMCHRLEGMEHVTLGGYDDGAILFGFGVGHEIHSHAFQPTGYLSFDYFCEKMEGLKQPWTRAVAFLVLCTLLPGRRPAFGSDQNEEYIKEVEVKLTSNWHIQLSQAMLEAQYV